MPHRGSKLLLGRQCFDAIQRAWEVFLILHRLDVVFESLECNENDAQIVKRSSFGRGMEHLIGNQAANSVQRGHLTLAVGKVTLLSGHIPNNLVDCVILQLIENAIRSYQHIVQLVNSIDLMCSFRVTSHDALHTTKMGQFSLTISKSSTDRESAGEHSIWTNEGVFFVITVFWIRANILLYLLCLSGWQSIFHNSLCLVNIPTCGQYAFEFLGARWLVIIRELAHI